MEGYAVVQKLAADEMQNGSLQGNFPESDLNKPLARRTLRVAEEQLRGGLRRVGFGSHPLL
jgi:hypothetical protein